MEIRNQLTTTLDDTEKRALQCILSEIQEGRYPYPWMEEFVHKSGGLESIEIVDTPEHSESLYDGYHIVSHPPAHKSNVVVTLSAIREKAIELEIREGQTQQLNAMFYPNAAVPDSVLKLALLYFDRVFLLFPDETVIRKEDSMSLQPAPQAQDSLVSMQHFTPLLYSDWERLITFFRETEELRTARILNFLSPRANPPDALYDAIQEDLRDPGFVQVVQSMKLPPMFVAGSKMPRQLLDDMLSLYESGAYSKATRLLFWTSLRLGEGRYYPPLKLAPQLGMSILLNHALLCCSRYELVPLTDRPTNEVLLLHKLSRMIGKPILEDYCSSRGIVSSVLAVKVLEQNLPCLHLRSYEEVLECREKLNDELGLFRMAMCRFAGAASVSTDPNEMRGEIEKVVDTEVTPAIYDLQSKLTLSKTKFFRNVLRDVKVGTIPFVASLLAGVPIPYLLALSAGVVTLESLLETNIEQRQLKAERNGLSYVIDCRRMLGHKRRWAF